MKWFLLILRIARGTMNYCLGGALTFAVAGLAEGILVGVVLALIFLPSDKVLAGWITYRALSLGAVSGFCGGGFFFTIAGFIQTTRGEFHYYDPQWRYLPRDAAFWNCLRSALWASATFGLAGGATGAFCGALWAVNTLPPGRAIPVLDYGTICLLNGSGCGAAVGYVAGIATGTLFPQSVQTARQRVAKWRTTLLWVWHRAKPQTKTHAERET